MHRKEPQLAERYQKDAREEAFLEALNAILAPYQEEDYQDLPEVFPTLHVIGVPRSGTTLMTQLIATHLDVGYINNLIARFWLAPVYGIRLSEAILPRGVASSYQSDCGRTTGICEPHEFGYFWAAQLGYGEMMQQDDDSVDWDRFRLLMTNMTHAFGRPMAMKSVFLAWHVAKVLEIMPKTVFVRIRRDPTENALSLLKFRRLLSGSVENWVSFRPLEYTWLKDEPYWRQVAGQVYYLEKAIIEQIERVAGRNTVQVDYSQLCHDPRRVLERIRHMLEMNGTKVALLSEPPASFEPKARPSNENSELVSKAVREFYGDRRSAG